MRNRETSDQEAPPVEPTWRGKAVGDESGDFPGFLEQSGLGGEGGMVWALRLASSLPHSTESK